MSTTTPAASANWYDKYPAPTAKVDYVTKDQVAEEVKSGNPKALIIDLRREDLVGGQIKTSLNIPAQTFYNSREDIYNLAENSGKEAIYLHCNRSTADRSRAWRVASWLQETADAKGNKVKIYAIEDGIVGFATGGKQYTDLLDNYDPAVWEKK